MVGYICHPLYLSSVRGGGGGGGGGEAGGRRGGRRGEAGGEAGGGGGEGEDALAINAPVTFSGISADHTNYLEHFFH